jgi:KDO2-lipid IV(A) lauroyltransferase
MVAHEPARREQSLWLRRLAHWGALEGPREFVRLSPPLIGAAFGLALPDMRQRIVRNLRRIHGQRGVFVEQAEAVQTLSNYAACFAESIAAGRKDVTPRVQVEGKQHLHDALGRGGVVVVTAHLGPWELTAQLLGTNLAANVALVMEPEPNREAREFQDRLRAQRGLRILHVGEHPTDALPLIAHLKSGGVAALQMDRVPPSGRVIDVSLFGKPFGVPEGPFRLAALSGAWVVPVFGRRRGFFDYELEIAEPVALSRRPSAEELLEGAQRAASAMQAFIEQTPTQWFHFAPD